MALGPHGMSYHLAEILHALIYIKDARLIDRLNLISEMAGTINSIISDEKTISQDDKDQIEKIRGDIKVIFAGYMPAVESDPNLFLARSNLEIQLIDARDDLLAIIKRNKLVTQDLLKTVSLDKPGDQATGEAL
jgi:hypothetical protein